VLLYRAMGHTSRALKGLSIKEYLIPITQTTAHLHRKK